VYNKQHFYGRVAEWPNASVLKTEVPQGTGGSNPSSSDFNKIKEKFIGQHTINLVLRFETQQKTLR
jgi:hypothetical protein